jgi:hypothetical protein
MKGNSFYVENLVWQIFSRKRPTEETYTFTENRVLLNILWKNWLRSEI